MPNPVHSQLEAIRRAEEEVKRREAGRGRPQRARPARPARPDLLGRGRPVADRLSRAGGRTRPERTAPPDSSPAPLAAPSLPDLPMSLGPTGAWELAPEPPPWYASPPVLIGGGAVALAGLAFLAFRRR